MTSQPAPAALQDETLDLLFDLTRGAPDRQLETGVVYDGKVTTLAGAGSVVLGIAALATEPNQRLTIAAVLAYGVVIAATLYCVWPRPFQVIRHADVLWAEHWDSTPRQIKHAVVAQSASSYAANKPVLRRKVRALVVALVAIATESVLIGLQVAGV